MSSAAAKRLFILVQAGLMWTISKAEASHCTPDQLNKCKIAAVEDNLDGLSAGGECKPFQYVDYTHQCEVKTTNNVQSTNWDYCCCAFEQKVFCCRYRYIYNFFRCDEEADTIYELPDPELETTTGYSDKTTTEVPLALEILIPAIVVPSVALLCFIFYCVRCCCCNDDDDEESRCCDLISRCRRRRRRRRKKNPPIRQEEQYHVSHDNQRSTLLPASLKDSSISSSSKTSSEKCDNFMDIKYPGLDSTSSRTQPTAPPYDASQLPDSPPPYNPGTYDPVFIGAGRSPNGNLVDGNLPCIHSKNEFGQEVIYQPVLAHAHIPLPVTRLSEQTQTLTPSELDFDADRQSVTKTEENKSER